MNSKFYKWCVVPFCKNTSVNAPNKVFIHVPYNKIVRSKWLKLARQDPETASNSSIYFCEDHFNLPIDMENYMEYHIMGTVSQVRMRPGCMPTKFACQPGRNAQNSCFELNRQKMMTLEEYEMPIEESCTITEPTLPCNQQSSDVKPKIKLAAPPEPGKQSALQNGCDACGHELSGVVYQCLQCPHRMCGSCDKAGVHKEHYVLRIPAHSPRDEVELVICKIRASLDRVELQPPQEEEKEASETDSASEAEAPAAGDSAQTAVEMYEEKIEVKEEVLERDPLEGGGEYCVLHDHAPHRLQEILGEARLELIPEIIKEEPPDDEFEVSLDSPLPALPALPPLPPLPPLPAVTHTFDLSALLAPGPSTSHRGKRKTRAARGGSKRARPRKKGSS